MGYIKEPAGVDFVVDPTPFTKADRKRISEIIAHYKPTVRKMPDDIDRKKKPTTKTRFTSSAKKRVCRIA